VYQVALVLETEEQRDAWVGYVEWACRKKFSPLLRGQILKAARERVKPAEAVVGDTVSELRSSLRGDLPRNVRLKVRLLTASGPNEAKAQHRFYIRLVEMIFKTVSPRLEAEFLPMSPNTRFDELVRGLVTTPPEYRLLVGPFRMIGRVIRGQIVFVPIPAWSIRLSCLAAHGRGTNQLSWAQVRGNALLDPRQQKDIRVLTIADEAADLYLRSFCGYTDAMLHTIKQYDLERAATEFATRLADPRQNANTVFVVGEFEGTYLRHKIRKDYHFDLVDLAAASEAGAPRYQLAFAVAEQDAAWAKVVREAMAELFLNSGALVAEEYAEYIVGAIREAISMEGAPGRPLNEVFEEVISPPSGGEPRSYICLSPLGLPVGTAFKERLRCALDQQIIENNWLPPELQGLPTGDRAVERELRRIRQRLVPELPSEKERIRHWMRQGRRQRRKQFGEIRQELAAIRRLLETMSPPKPE
jgi:hypothetical protein